MREIKFRLYDITMNAILSVHNIDINGKEARCILIPSKNLASASTKEVIRYVDLAYTPLMQFTGLKDNFSNDIYEGDILKIFLTSANDDLEEETYFTLVRYEQGAFIVDCNSSEYRETVLGWAFDYWDNDGFQCAVVGNIYKNKDLLNETT